MKLDDPGSLGEDAFAYVTELLRRRRAAVFVELGSGLSTVRFARALPELEIVSIDHDAGWAARVSALLAEHAPASPARVVHVPLGAVPGCPGLRYGDALIEALPPAIDVALIDGPPWLSLRGREHGLHALYDRLPPGSLVVLDDHDRAIEQQIVRNWLEVYADGFSCEHVAVGHGLALLEKRAPVTPRWDGPLRAADQDALRAREVRIRDVLAAIDDRVADKLMQLHMPELRGHLPALRQGYGVPPAATRAEVPAQAQRLAELRRLFFDLGA